MNFLQKFRDFIKNPSQSRTMGLLAMLVLVSAVSLTVIVAQQQQTIKQQASETDYAQCGQGLGGDIFRSCKAATETSSCDGGWNKCLSTTDFGDAALQYPDGKNLVCCPSKGFSMENGVCTLVNDPDNQGYGYFQSPTCNDKVLPPPCGDGHQCDGLTLGESCPDPQQPQKCLSDSPMIGGSRIEGKWLACCSVPYAPAAPDTCTQNGGSCIPMAPCVPPTVQNTTYSCGSNTNGSVCCMQQVSSPAAPPTTSACSSYSTCGTCQPSDSCGWCSNSSQCKHGSASGSDDGLCTGSNWAFTAGSCATSALPPTTPNLFNCEQTITNGSALIPNGIYQCANSITGVGTQCGLLGTGFQSFPAPAGSTGTTCQNKNPAQGCCIKPATQPANPFACQNQAGTYAGNYQCASIINGSDQCVNITGGNWTLYSKSYTSCDPSSANSVTSACCKQNTVVVVGGGGGATGNNGTISGDTIPSAANVIAKNAAGSIVNSAITPLNNFSLPVGTYTFTFSKSCYEDLIIDNIPIVSGDNGSNTLGTLVAINPPPAGCSNTVSPAGSSSITLNLALIGQDPMLTGSSLNVNILKFIDVNPGSNSSPVAGVPTSLSFTPTSVSGQYQSALPSLSLLQHRYSMVVGIEKRIAKYDINVSGSGPVAANAILTYGDADGNGDINLYDYTPFINCWKGKVATGNCTLSDFDSNGVVDQVDFNTYLRGLTKWRTL